jgi:CDP-diacylglycerol--glycerol-3-phosphate 3-phosphatidyltransferase
MEKVEKKRINLPNKITICRMIIVLAIIVLALLPRPESWVFEIFGIKHDYRSISILVLFVVGSASDWLDGYLARKNNLVTTFGKFMDPIADKLLVNTLFIIIAAGGLVHFIVPIIMIARDTVVDAIRMIAVGEGKVIAASKLGKLKTVTQMIALIVILAIPLPMVQGEFLHIGMVAYIAAIASLISGIDYFVKNRKTILKDLRS